MSEDRKQLLRDDEDDQDHLVPPNQNTSSSSKMPSTQWDMRTISLAVLTLQNAILGISMRKATTSEGSMGFDNSKWIIRRIRLFHFQVPCSSTQQRC